MMPEQGEQDDDRNRNPKQPQQCASAKPHDNLLFQSVPTNALR
jgi:hypothetical protein